jgi:hypothetical protein
LSPPYGTVAIAWFPFSDRFLHHPHSLSFQEEKRICWAPEFAIQAAAYVNQSRQSINYQQTQIFELLSRPWVWDVHIERLQRLGWECMCHSLST